jgi:DNA-binding LacI/PurR family transcriptional regulator
VNEKDHMKKLSQPTIKDVAKEAGVSVGTTSNHITGRSPVSEKSSGLIKKAIKKLGYRHNVIAARLRQQRSMTIGICIPELSNPFFHKLMQSLNREMENDFYDSILVETSDVGKRNNIKLQALYSKQVDGVFLIPHLDWDGWVDTEVPMILLDRPRKKEFLPSIALDNFSAAITGTEYLFELGHKSVWFVVNTNELWNASERQAGFKDIALRFGYHEQCSVIEGGMSAHDIAETINKMLKKRHPPTAIFASNEYAALGVLRSLSKNNIQVPEQISILTFDDAHWTNILNPSVTVLRQPVEEMARLAWLNMKTLLRGDSIKNRSIKLRGKLVIRESVLTKIGKGEKIAI